MFKQMHFPPQGTALHLQYRATSATVPTQLLWDHIWGVRSQLWSIWKESQHHTKTNSKNPWPVQNISWPFKPETDPLVKGIIFPCLCSDISSHSDALLPRLRRSNFPAKWQDFNCLSCRDVFTFQIKSLRNVNIYKVIHHWSVKCSSY